MAAKIGLATFSVFLAGAYRMSNYNEKKGLPLFYTTRIKSSIKVVKSNRWSAGGGGIERLQLIIQAF